MYRGPIQCTPFIKYTQFQYHCYLESPKEIVQETKFFGKCFIGTDFGVTFGVNCDLKGRVWFKRRLWELCHTVVAKMLHRCYGRVSSTRVSCAYLRSVKVGLLSLSLQRSAMCIAELLDTPYIMRPPHPLSPQAAPSTSAIIGLGWRGEGWDSHPYQRTQKLPRFRAQCRQSAPPWLVAR